MYYRRSAATLCAALTLGCFLAGCSDSSSPNNDNANPPALTAEYYAQARINGTYETQQAENGSTTIISPAYEGSSGSADDGGYIVSQLSSFSKVDYAPGSIPALDPTYRSIGIMFIKKYPQEPSVLQYNQLVRQGTMPFGSYFDEKEGVEIRWRDAAGTLWSTALGSGDQTGSTFTVTSNTPITVNPGQSINGHYKTSGTFSATLYDTKGNSMPITDGKFTVATVFY